MSAAEEATEVVAEVAEEVAEQATHIAEVSRGFSGHDAGLIFGGFVFGAGVGGTLAYIFAKRQLETKYKQIASEEISEMSQHYRDKALALDSEANKSDLEELVRERGYSSDASEPPMAVTPPTAVVEAAQIEEEEVQAEAVPEEPEVRNVFRDAEVADNWDWHKERARRSPRKPYVIHIEERDEQQAYDGVTFTYYEDDDVVCNERDEPLDEADRERILGEENLAKFGHGSGDASVVYIRNDQLEMDIELIRSPNSFAEEVHGFEPEIRHMHRHRGRPRFDDE